MAVEIKIPYQKSFVVGKPLRETDSCFLHPAECIQKNFPGLESLTQKSEGVYEWIFEELSQAGYNLQIRFETKFQGVGTDTIEIVPSGKGGTSIQGRISRRETQEGTAISFDWSILLSLPIPFLLKGMAQKFAEKELTKLFDRFASNVQKTLS